MGLLKNSCTAGFSPSCMAWQVLSATMRIAEAGTTSIKCLAHKHQDWIGFESILNLVLIYVPNNSILNIYSFVYLGAILELIDDAQNLRFLRLRSCMAPGMWMRARGG